MSRGGFGGGRGGGGRGGFGGLAGPGRAGMEVSTGTLTREDLKETTSIQEHGVLYPVSMNRKCSINFMLIGLYKISAEI